LEAKLEGEKSENGWNLLFSTARAKFYLVANFLWAKITIIGTNRDCDNVGIYSDDYEEVLSSIAIGILYTRAISLVGKLCHLTKRGNCGIKLKFRPKVLSVCLPNFSLP
jgi:hypothetical protein